MTIIIPKKVYLTIVGAAVRFANARIPREKWLEVNGIFVGINEGKGKYTKVIISDAYPIMHEGLDETAVIPKYEYSAEDSVSYMAIDDEAFSRDLRSLL